MGPDLRYDPTQDLFENLAVREVLVVLSITGVVIRVHPRLGGQPMLHLASHTPDFGVLVVATTDESHGLQVETLQSSVPLPVGIAKNVPKGAHSALRACP